MITKQEHGKLTYKYNLYHSERNRLFVGKNYVDKEMALQLPEPITNEEISAIEVYEFINDPPERYFAYINEKDKTMTTWTGDILGKVLGLWSLGWRSNFGDIRVSIEVIGINGKRYHGTFYKSAGDYCRIKSYKD